MAIDITPLLTKVAEFADEIEAEYGPEAELVSAVVWVEISHENDDGDDVTTVEGRSLDSNTYAVGITIRGLRALLEG
jgi:hypothetical protein